jgi:dsDNA-specific endonuclease/ATPase MutS2
MKNGTMTIDLHGLQSMDAEFNLRCFIDAAPPNTHTIQVIHGIGTGALKNMVHDLRHPRIVSRALCIGNAGQTNLYLENFQ